jgi:hypothetical protein
MFIWIRPLIFDFLCCCYWPKPKTPKKKTASNSNEFDSFDIDLSVETIHMLDLPNSLVSVDNQNQAQPGSSASVVEKITAAKSKGGDGDADSLLDEFHEVKVGN